MGYGGHKHVHPIRPSLALISELLILRFTGYDALLFRPSSEAEIATWEIKTIIPITNAKAKSIVSLCPNLL